MFIYSKLILFIITIFCASNCLAQNAQRTPHFERLKSDTFIKSLDPQEYYIKQIKSLPHDIKKEVITDLIQQKPVNDESLRIMSLNSDIAAEELLSLNPDLLKNDNVGQSLAESLERRSMPLKLICNGTIQDTTTSKRYEQIEKLAKYIGKISCEVDGNQHIGTVIYLSEGRMLTTWHVLLKCITLASSDPLKNGDDLFKILDQAIIKVHFTQEETGCHSPQNINATIAKDSVISGRTRNGSSILNDFVLIKMNGDSELSKLDSNENIERYTSLSDNEYRSTTDLYLIGYPGRPYEHEQQYIEYCNNYWKLKPEDCRKDIINKFPGNGVQAMGKGLVYLGAESNNFSNYDSFLHLVTSWGGASGGLLVAFNDTDETIKLAGLHLDSLKQELTGKAGFNYSAALQWRKLENHLEQNK